MKDLVDKVVAEINPRYTRTPYEALDCTIRRTLEAIDAGIPGDLVECGTWKGGCSFAMLLAQRYAYGKIQRPVWMFDSFEGMSPPATQDGAGAAGWWASAAPLPKDVPNENFCICPLPYVLEAIAELGLEDHTIVRKGWFSDTLTDVKVALPKSIALLRVDCDWYEPVRCVLESLVPLVSPGAAIILDDYHAWEGCVRATYDFLNGHNLDWPINEIANRNGAWMVRA